MRVRWGGPWSVDCGTEGSIGQLAKTRMSVDVILIYVLPWSHHDIISLSRGLRSQSTGTLCLSTVEKAICRRADVMSASLYQRPLPIPSSSVYCLHTLPFFLPPPSVLTPIINRLFHFKRLKLEGEVRGEAVLRLSCVLRKIFFFSSLVAIYFCERRRERGMLLSLTRVDLFCPRGLEVN